MIINEQHSGAIHIHTFGLLFSDDIKLDAECPSRDFSSHLSRLSRVEKTA